MGNNVENIIDKDIRCFCLSSDIFSHFKAYIYIKKENGEYKTIEDIIIDMKTILINYILHLDFNNLNKLKDEFILEDLWILENMLQENNTSNLNSEFLINEIVNSHYGIHDYDINQVINAKKEDVFYICNHAH